MKVLTPESAVSEYKTKIEIPSAVFELVDSWITNYFVIYENGIQSSKFNFDSITNILSKYAGYHENWLNFYKEYEKAGWVVTKTNGACNSTYIEFRVYNSLLDNDDRDRRY